MAIRLATATQNAAADAAVDQVDLGAAAGTVKLYTGAQPASANDTIGASTLLATFTLADPAFGAAASGVATLAGTPLATTGVAAGDAGWARMESSTPATVMDGSVTASGGGGDFIVDNVTIAVDQNLSLVSGTITAPTG